MGNRERGHIYIAVRNRVTPIGWEKDPNRMENSHMKILGKYSHEGLEGRKDFLPLLLKSAHFPAQDDYYQEDDHHHNH